MTVYDTMDWAKAQTTGSTAAKAVLMALAERTGDRPVCCPSQELLAAELEMSERSVRTHLRALETRGLIVTRRRYLTLDGRPVARGRAFNEYELLVPEAVDNGVVDDQPATPAGGQVCGQVRPTGKVDPTNRQPVAGKQGTNHAAAAVDVGPSTGDQVELPLVDPDPVATTRAQKIRAACQLAAERSVRADVDAGKIRVRSIPKYAEPRARDTYEPRYRDRLAAMIDDGHGIEAMADQILAAEAGFMAPLAPVAPPSARPRLPEFRQAAFDETDEWRQLQPVDLAARRAEAIEAARAQIAATRTATDDM